MGPTPPRRYPCPGTSPSKLNSSARSDGWPNAASTTPGSPVSIDLRCRADGRSRRQQLLRKEVIQPQVPLRLPCYDFTPVTSHTMDGCPPRSEERRVGKKSTSVCSPY